MVTSTYLSIALPVEEKPILVDFEQAVGLVIGIVLIFDPPVEGRALEKELGHFPLPVKLELLRHPDDDEFTAELRNICWLFLTGRV